MKRLLLFLVIVFTSIILPQQERYYTFSELRGMEDKFGNTHLFYRLYNNYDSSGSLVTNNSVYHINVSSGIDELFLTEYINDNSASYFVGDFDFWGNDPAKYIALKTFCGFECNGFIERFDTTIDFPFYPGVGSNIEISKLNDSIIYASNPFSKSTDGGKTWTPNFDYQFVSQSPASANEFFILNNDQQLLKTKDNGTTFYIADSSYSSSMAELYYDKNNQYLYRLYSQYGIYKLSVSNNSGEPFSWSQKYESPNIIFISVDESQSGVVYLADGRRIFKSTDYGNTFNLFKELDKRLVGIYKKPNSNKLYAATKYKLMEIENDSVKILKQLKLDPEIFSYYPLALGNKWFYVWYDWAYPYWDSGVSVTEITNQTIINGNKYFVFNNEDYVFGSSNYERIDSVNGTVLRYLDTADVIIEDLTAEYGDSILVVNRFRNRGYENPLTYVDSSRILEMFGNELVLTKVFYFSDLEGFEYGLSHKYGLSYYRYGYDFGVENSWLKGCIINGVVYGDTTVVGIEDETQSPQRFSLSQNYPNPFNPVTKIKYVIGSRQYATLKVYDILGNEIATLVNEEKPAGEYEVQFDGRNLASGIYFYTLRTGNYTLTKKLILMK